MQIVLATTRALNYGNQLAAKTHATLKSIAKLGRIPLLSGSHDGDQAGEVTGLKYQRRGDLGVLVGTIKQSLPAGWGCSLQYEGSISGGRIRFQPSDLLHAAILPNPRDTMTVRDSDGYLLFRDSENDETINGAEGKTATEATDQTEAEATDQTEATETPIEQPELEVDTEALVEALATNETLRTQLVDQIIESAALSDYISNLISEKLAEKEPEPERPKTKVIVKPKQPDRNQATARPPRPIQQKLIPLA